MFGYASYRVKVMTQSFRSIAGEVAAEIYNHKLPPTAEEFLNLLEPIPDKIFDLLPCFKGCKSLDDLYLLCSGQLNDQSIHGAELLREIENFGTVGYTSYSDSQESTVQPNWFTVGIQTDHYKYYRHQNQGQVFHYVQQLTF